MNLEPVARVAPVTAVVRHEVPAGRRLVGVDVDARAIHLTLCDESRDPRTLGAAVPRVARVRRIKFEAVPAADSIARLLDKAATPCAGDVLTQVVHGDEGPVLIPTGAGKSISVASSTDRHGRVLVTLAERDRDGRPVPGEFAAVSVPGRAARALALVLRRIATGAECRCNFEAQTVGGIRSSHRGGR